MSNKILKSKFLKGEQNNTVSFQNISISANPGSTIDSLLFPGNGIIQSLTSNGVTIESPINLISVYFNVERISFTTIFTQITNNFSNTLITCLTPNTIITGSLLNPTFDFFYKTITISEMAINTELQLTFTNLITADSDTSNKTITFNKAGQSLTFIWDSVLQKWFIKDSGCFSLS